MAPDDISSTPTDPFAPPSFMKDAVSLPAAVYTDPDVYAREIDACFRKGWMSIASASQAPNKGDVLAVEALGEPLLIARDAKGEVHVFYNVCRHRGVKLMAEGAGHCGNGLISCPYHKWAYALDGSLKAAPYFGGSEGSAPAADEKAQMGLIEIRSAIWCDTVFVNLSGDAEPFEDFIAPLAERWKSVDTSLMRLAMLEAWRIPTNWKFAVENGLDLYHLPWVHPELGTAEQSFLDIEYAYVSEKTFGYIMPHFDRPRDSAEIVANLFPNLDPKLFYALDLIYLFPNTLFLMTPSWVQVLTMSPSGPGETNESLAGYLVGDGMLEEQWSEYRQEFAGWLKMVNDQDVSILTALQQGRATAATDKGLYAPYWDQLADYFAKLIERQIAANV